ncbi:hypothetical protein BDN67DRAFT_967105 [Paxillus ammoniavirescens]|nr:hypothetical protein BDN67DRAFT_967105 [Paxillus ammoniavirescens]
MSDTTITFFDIPTTIPGPVAISPNTWRIRLILNYKKLRYQTCWVEVADIETICKARGIPHSTVKPDGTPKFTLPAIIDHKPSGDVAISESLRIAEYLEKEYLDPESSRAIIPLGTTPLLKAYEHHILAYITSRLWPLVALDIYSVKTPADQDRLCRHMQATFGKRVQEIVLVGEAREVLWKEIENAFDVVAGGIAQNGGQYLMGNNPCFVDFTLCGLLMMFRYISSDEAWPQICAWRGGFWKDYFNAFLPYFCPTMILKSQL